MKVNVKIKKLPKEFDFKSNINPLGLTYHATEMDDRYVVQCGLSMWDYDKQNFHNRLLRKEYVICN